MRAILLPNGNLLIPADMDDVTRGSLLREIGPDHPDYGRWLPFAEQGEDPRDLAATERRPTKQTRKTERGTQAKLAGGRLPKKGTVQ